MNNPKSRVSRHFAQQENLPEEKIMLNHSNEWYVWFYPHYTIVLNYYHQLSCECYLGNVNDFSFGKLSMRKAFFPPVCHIYMFIFSVNATKLHTKYANKRSLLNFKHRISILRQTHDYIWIWTCVKLRKKLKDF